MNQAPLVSVVMPCLNEEEAIGPCIEKIRRTLTAAANQRAPKGAVNQTDQNAASEAIASAIIAILIVVLA
jgi:hypothetical protein